MALNKSNIDWCLPDGRKLEFTFNPVTGCRRGCGVTPENPKGWCYARRIHERFNKSPFWEVVFHPERLLDPIKHKKPAVIFVGSMSDPEYWRPEWWAAILETCRKCPQHTFMFLSKGDYDNMPIRGNLPANIMWGYTITGDYFPPPFANNSFLSIEPLLNNIILPLTYRYQLVICGPMSGVSAIKPRNEWIESVRLNVPEDKLYWKRAMIPFIGYSGFESERRRQRK